MTNEERDKKRFDLLMLAESAIQTGGFNENQLKQAELYMQLADMYRIRSL